MKHVSGIYQITNTITGHRYVGSALRCARRWTKHKCALRRNKGHNAPLQRAWNRYGESSLEFKILLICAPANLIDYEQRALDVLQPEYNICPTAGSSLGTILGPMSAEQKEKISRGNKGIVKSPAWRVNLSLAHKGRIVSQETRAKLAAANIGKKHSEETRNKMSASQQGKIITPEQRRKRSEATTAYWERLHARC